MRENAAEMCNSMIVCWERNGKAVESTGCYKNTRKKE